MKTITDDPKGFFESGGWTFLDPESDGENGAAGSDESEEDDVSFLALKIRRFNSILVRLLFVDSFYTNRQIFSCC